MDLEAWMDNAKPSAITVQPAKKDKLSRKGPKGANIHVAASSLVFDAVRDIPYKNDRLQMRS
ncbi:hypothetical protein RvY_04070 [Ramazzottius varieornatus]|uniref:Uncharacterized protein n=1 Tax=Ramazzottius varieornatus TaxID=947166 RepID=A0A1D1UVZ0_RAMVA|nr:hypothetical protein RvY_04070 [Ramazzottius varieornatus]